MRLISLRTSLARRPLLPAAAGLALGIASAPYGWPWALAAAAVAFATSAALTGARAAALVAGFVGVGAVAAVLAATPARDDLSGFAAWRFVEVEGAAAADPQPTERGMTVIVGVQRVGLPDGRRVRCSASALVSLPPGAPSVVYGDGLRLRGVLDRPHGSRNPGLPNYAGWLERRGVRSVLRVQRAADLSVVSASGAAAWSAPALAARCRARILRTFDRAFTPLEAALAAGVVLGCKRGLPPALLDRFASAGASHLLAASGMNVGILAAAVACACSALGVGRRRRAAITLGGVAFFVLVAGGEPSVARAGLMAAIVLGGELLEREPDLINSLAAATLVLLLVDPLSLHEPALQLSVVTVAGIGASAPLFDLLRRGCARRGGADTGQRLGRAASEVAAIAAVAQLWSAPLVAAYFHVVPVVGVLANVALAPFAAGALLGGAVVGLAGTLFPPLAAPLGALVSPLYAGMLGVVDSCARAPCACVAAGTPGPAVVAALYGLIGAAQYAANRRASNALLRREPWRAEAATT